MKYSCRREFTLAFCVALVTGCIGTMTVTFDPQSEAQFADMRALIPFCVIHGRSPTSAVELVDFAAQGNVKIGMANGTNWSFVTTNGQTAIAYDFVAPNTGHVAYSFAVSNGTWTTDPEASEELERGWREQAGTNKSLPNN